MPFELVRERRRERPHRADSLAVDDYEKDEKHRTVTLTESGVENIEGLLRNAGLMPTGTLYDNVTINGNRLQARNAGNEGTGHGWNGANMVFWNSTASTFLVENPPTSQNWAIGDQGSSNSGNGIYDSWGAPVDVRSLYYAQLADRRGDQ